MRAKHALYAVISFHRSGNGLTTGSTLVQDGALFELAKRGIQFDVYGEPVVMEVDTALHFTAPVQFREVNTAFYIEDVLGFA
jgi:hypothetical protein